MSHKANGCSENNKKGGVVVPAAKLVGLHFFHTNSLSRLAPRDDGVGRYCCFVVLFCCSKDQQGKLRFGFVHIHNPPIDDCIQNESFKILYLVKVDVG